MTTNYNHELMIDIKLSGIMTEDDVDTLDDAVIKNNTKALETLYKKYLPIYQKQLEDDDSDQPIKHDALAVYNGFRKTLKVQMMKEEVLEEHDFICFMCKHQYPNKEEFKKKHKKKTYPLFVRCLFSVPKFIESNKLYDVQSCLKHPDLRNKVYYLPICLDCKPSRFAK